jgi:hypothetical protein
LDSGVSAMVSKYFSPQQQAFPRLAPWAKIFRPHCGLRPETAQVAESAIYAPPVISGYRTNAHRTHRKDLDVCANRKIQNPALIERRYKKGGLVVRQAFQGFLVGLGGPG